MLGKAFDVHSGGILLFIPHNLQRFSIGAQ
jgi:hypothetical protein